MDDAELVGGVLDDSPEPSAAARELSTLLLAARPDRAAARRAGLDPDLVDVVRTKLAGDPDRIAAASALGAAWVRGRRSVPVADAWDLVASLPQGARLPAGLRRTTGETLMRLVVEARRTLRLASPFIDRYGLDFLADALAAATVRGVRLEILLPTRSTHAEDAVGELRRTIRQHGSPSKLEIASLRYDAPWAHLKVLTADSVAAYLGSANITGAGIAGRNLELGVLVRGATVAVIEEILDQFRQM